MTSRAAGRAFLVLACLCLPAASALAQAPPPLERVTAADLEGGAAVYAAFCVRCHGVDGKGAMGPPLARPTLRRASDTAEVIGILFDGIPGTAMLAAWWLSEREMQQVAEYVRSLGRRPPEQLPGDPARGLSVYATRGCAACHIVDGSGAGMGPDLSAIGLLRGRAFLRESILDPAAARPERPLPYEPYSSAAYVVVRAQPRQGAAIAGTRVNEDPFTIQLRDELGRIHSLRKADLARLEIDPAASVMPSYRGQMSEAEIDDLVAYLMTRQAVR